MKRRIVSLETAVEAFRELTSTGADGAATRARVLARASGGRDCRTSQRRMSFVASVVVVLLSSAAAAWTIASRRPDRLAARVIEVEVRPTSTQTGSGRPSRVIPVSTSLPEQSIPGERPDREQIVYRVAHEAHFVAEDPARALRLWDAYLRAYPMGSFAPEARFNRALDLIRLFRFDEAARALRPFAKGPLGGYREHDAAVLLDWLAARGRAPSASVGDLREAPAQKSKPPASE